LSIPCEERYGALAMTPQKHKDETLRSLVDLTEAAARKQPSVMLFEDVHWADPTTLEVLDLLIDRVRGIPLLIVLTHRPESASRWGSHGHITALNLSKLTRAQSGAMVSKVAGGKALPPELLEQILTKTDGVPLFVEELTKSILESGELKQASDRYEYIGSAHSMTIPATLRDSLMARLDLIWSLTGGSDVIAFMGDWGHHLELIAEARELARKHGLPFVEQIVCPFHEGFARIFGKDFAAGERCMRQGADGWAGAGGRTELTQAYTLLSEALTGLGRYDDAWPTSPRPGKLWKRPASAIGSPRFTECVARSTG
jgi:hypothetical protein